jgi:DNA-binding CsgD family transcriptional regulator
MTSSSGRGILARRLDSADALSVLTVALDLLGTAAFVVKEPGHVLLANTPGRRLLEIASTGTLEEIKSSMPSLEPTSPYALTPVGRISGGEAYLAVRRNPTSTDGHSARVSALAVRWRLTRRQMDVLALIMDGHSNGSIAETLDISAKTVEQHLKLLFQKAGVKRRSLLIARAHRGP